MKLGRRELAAGVVLGSGLLAALAPGLPGLRALQFWLCASTARLTGALLDLVGVPTYVDATRVHAIGYSLEIVPSCTALVPVVVVGLALALLPGERLRRISLGLLGVALVVALNLLRLITLLLIGTRSTRAFEAADTWVFPALAVVVFALGAGVWLRAWEQEAEPELES